MREFILTKLVCSKCGNNLTVTNTRPATTTYAEGEPTGASKVELVVSVEPCVTCNIPLFEIRRAVATLITAAQEPRP